MMDQLSIIQICPCYVDLDKETGGVANIVRQICLQLTRQQKHVHLFCGNRELGESKASPGQRQINEYLTIEIFDQKSHPLLGPTGKLTRYIQGLRQASVAHVHTCFSAFTESSMHMLHRRRIPFVFTPHGKLSQYSFRQHYWSKKLWWMSKAQRAIANSRFIGASSVEEASQLAELNVGSPVHVVANGYEIPTDLVNREYPRIINGPYILFLGYLDPRKQPHFLLEAFASARACQSHHLVFVGPDSYSIQESIEQRARELNIHNQVVFYGPAYGAQKWNLLKHATCLCLPSLGEGLPVVLCEAMGAGIPTIFSQECNFSEVATQGAGIVLKGFEALRWGQAIDSVCLDSCAHNEMKAAAMRLSSRYTWREIGMQWLALYELAWRSGRAECQEGNH